MSKRVGGFINQDGLNAPNEPTGVTASAGDEQATVSFTAPSDVGGSAITGFVATSNDGIGATGGASPVTVPGLTNGSAYTFRVWALNAFGYSAPSGVSGSVTPEVLVIGLFAGGLTAGGADSAVNVIDFINLNSTGNATDFGDLSVSRFELGGGSGGSSTRGLFFGGENTSGTKVDVVDYITFAAAGNAVDFGNLTGARNRSGVCSSSTRALSAGGGDAISIDYFTIASTGNGLDFGDLNGVAQTTGLSGLASPTRGVFGSVANGSGNAISYVTIASTGNALDFGDLLVSAQNHGSGSNATRGIFTPGGVSNVIQYVTIASTGNATDFGDLSVTRNGVGGASSAHGGLS